MKKEHVTMSMIINFYPVPDELTQQVENKSTSIINLADYVQKKFLDDEDQHNDHLELYYHTSFAIIERLYNATINTDEQLPVLGFQDYSNEEADELLSDYVTYSAGYLTHEDVKKFVSKLGTLSFDDLWKQSLGEDARQKSSLVNSIEKDLGVSAEELLEQSDILKEYYDSFVDFIKNITTIGLQKRLGLFISVD
jgi:hypothetical protein